MPLFGSQHRIYRSRGFLAAAMIFAMLGLTFAATGQDDQQGEQETYKPPAPIKKLTDLQTNFLRISLKKDVQNAWDGEMESAEENLAESRKKLEEYNDVMVINSLKTLIDDLGPEVCCGTLPKILGAIKLLHEKRDDIVKLAEKENDGDANEVEVALQKAESALDALAWKKVIERETNLELKMGHVIPLLSKQIQQILKTSE